MTCINSDTTKAIVKVITGTSIGALNALGLSQVCNVENDHSPDVRGGVVHGFPLVLRSLTLGNRHQLCL